MVFPIAPRAGKLLRLCLALLTMLLGTAAPAAGWGRYTNVRFEYGVDLPPGFSSVHEAANSDGGTSGAAFGRAALSVWGTYLVDASFNEEIAARMDSDIAEGWSIGYKAIGARAASWSATKGGRIQYTRAVAQCKDRAAYVLLEYDAEAKDGFDPIVTRLARSLRGNARCGASG